MDTSNVQIESEVNSAVTTVRKEVEFETFLKIIKKGKVKNWSIVAEALGVREATISEWKKHPLAKRAITDGVEYCLEEMEKVGKDDWKMWREKLKMLGVKDRDYQPVASINIFNQPEFIKEYQEEI